MKQPLVFLDNYNFESDEKLIKSLYVDIGTKKDITEDLFELSKSICDSPKKLAVFDPVMNIFITHPEKEDIAFDYHNIRMSYLIARNNYDLDRNNKYYQEIYNKTEAEFKKIKNIYLGYVSSPR